MLSIANFSSIITDDIHLAFPNQYDELLGFAICSTDAQSVLIKACNTLTGGALDFPDLESSVHPERYYRAWTASE